MGNNQLLVQYRAIYNRILLCNHLLNLYTADVHAINYTEQKKFSNFNLNKGNFHCIIYKALQFHLSISSNTHRKQLINDQHNMCNMTSSSVSILRFLLNSWSRLIACNLKANIHRGVISNTCAHAHR
jgi:hypothetical protein